MIIKFNLLPKLEKKEKEREESKLSFFKIYSIILASIIIGMLLLAFKTERNLIHLEKEKKEKNEMLMRYKAISNKVKEIEKKTEELEKRIEIIVSLKEKQGLTLKKLYTLLIHTSSNKVFFESLQMNDTQAKIKGMCYDIDLLANYMNNIELNRDIIKATHLKSAETKRIGTTAIYSFELEVLFK